MISLYPDHSPRKPVRPFGDIFHADGGLDHGYIRRLVDYSEQKGWLKRSKHKHWSDGNTPNACSWASRTE